MDINDLLKEYVKRVQEAPDRAVLLKEGQAAKLSMVLLKGKAKVQKRTDKGLVTVDVLGPGSIIGEMRIIAPDLVSATATIVADGPVTVGILDAERLEAEYTQVSPPLRDVMRTLVVRLKEATDDLGAAAAERFSAKQG